jgi:PKD repeat protein
VNGAAGTSFLYAIAASGSPTSYSASGLPAGLSLNASTGLITGTPTTAGSYVVTLNATNASGTGSITLNLIVAASAAPTANPGRLIDLSVNSQVTSTSPIIMGFVISGTQPQNVLLRAIGPTLASYGVTNSLAAPHLRLFNAGGTLLLERDGWDGSGDLSATFARLGAFALAGGSADAAVLVTLSPGVYSMHVTTTSSTGGIALAEIYDASATPPPDTASRLVNISVRSGVGGGRMVTGGFVIVGDAPKRILIRGVGPGLTAYGVPNALPDPMITLFRSQNGTSTAVASNGNWQTTATLNTDYPVGTATEVAAATATVGGFALASGSADAAILVTLPPGVYSAQVDVQSGSAGTGDALVEIYDAP